MGECQYNQGERIHMLDTLINKPLLGIVLIIFLVWNGVRSTKPRTIRYRQLYILPSIFLFISANQLFNSYTLSAGSILVWLIATIVAGGISWRFVEKMPAQIDRSTGMIELPGTWVALSLVLFFIGARLYFGRQLYTTPALRTDQGFITQIVVTTGLLTGYYLGRSSSFLIRFFRTSS